MTVIKNSTGKVVTVFNSRFSKDIPIDECLTLTDEDLCGDYNLAIAYFSLKGEKREVDLNVEESSWPRKRVYLSFKNESQFPIVSFVNVQGLAELELISHDVTLIGLIKQIRLKCIVCTDKEKALIADHAFTDEKDQKCCRKLMRLALILMFPIPLLLMPVGIYWLFNDEVVFAVMAFLFSIPWGIDLVYFLKMRKWKIAQKAEYE
ncbi:MAG: hypothetical protein E7599_01215 [Ruminococcaceae bacterium]|nr:hypothetical protein [Oscillospiraceae bacterium]